MDINIFSDLFDLGLHPIPLDWSNDDKTARVHPEHGTDITGLDGKPVLNDVVRWMGKLKKTDGVALKLYPPFFMFDFDTKNTNDKTIYTEWLNIVYATNEDILRKVCIEKTRNDGVHIYCKFSGVTQKKTLAKSEDGSEVISIYTGGLLSYCSPTPGYELIHNDFSDIEELTQDEFDCLVAASIHFNKNQKAENYTPGEKIVYPIQYESTALQFDTNCTEKALEELLNSMGLEPAYNKSGNLMVKDVKFNGIVKDTYYHYLRKGSLASFSAKVSFFTNQLFLFSGSFTDYPNFHTRVSDKDNTWRLTPTKILFYRSGQDWQKTMLGIKEISAAHNIKIVETAPVTNQAIIHEDRLRFPYDIFPESVQQYIFAQSIQHEYLAGSVLAALSTCIGNSVYLEAMPGYIVKPILYMSIVAPPGASKSPAMSKAFAPIEKYDNDLYKSYNLQLEDYKKKLMDYEKDKKKNEKPEKPGFPQTLIKDSTIEMVVKILSFNKNGCCLVADELIGFLNRMNQYKAGDEIQKWLSMWSGDPILLQRITRDENKVEEPFCTIVGGIQPGVLESLSKEENSHNGFYHRFLFVFPKPQQKRDWEIINIPENIKFAFNDMFVNLLHQREAQRVYYRMDNEANLLYTEWFNNKNRKYNKAISENVMGIIAKYQDYCLRFALIIQVIYDGSNRSFIVTQKSVERAIRLTEYFLGMMHKALKILAPETPIDKLTGVWETIYIQLPQSFTTQTLVTTAVTLGIKEGTAKVFLSRQEGKIFNKIDRNTYEKMF